MEIKILTKEHFENLKVLMQDYKKSIHEDLLNKNQLTDLEAAINDKKIAFYIVLENNEIIGMCSVSLLFSTYKCKPVGMFDDFYIKPEYRKKGFAIKLTEYVFDDMKSKNIKSVMVGCSDIDIEMYKHCGFNLILGNLLSCDGT